RLRNAEQRRARDAPARALRRHVVARIPEHCAWRLGDCAHQQRRQLLIPVALSAVADRAVNRRLPYQWLAQSLAAAAWTPFGPPPPPRGGGGPGAFARGAPASTAPDCSGGGQRRQRSLSDRIATGPCSGRVLDRDLHAARTLLRLANAPLGLGQPSRAQAEKPPAKAGGSCHLRLPLHSKPDICSNLHPTQRMLVRKIAPPSSRCTPDRIGCPTPGQA